MRRYAIVIPSFFKGLKTEWLLTQCLDSIAKLEPTLLEHTMILDDASPLESQVGIVMAKLHKKYGIHVHFKKENKGYSANINEGLRLAKESGYDAVLTLNNDVELKTPFMGNCDEIFDKDPKVAIIGALLFFQDGRIQHSGFEVREDGTCDLYEAGHFTYGLDDRFRTERYIMGVTGAFQVIDLHKLDTIGFYDERYQMAFEDVEFCLRTWSKGFRVYYDPNIYAIHCESVSRGRELGPREHMSLNRFIEDCYKYNLVHIRERVLEAIKTSSLGIKQELIV